jgi:hypothetical protein
VFDRNVFDQNDVDILLAPASGNAGNHTIAGNRIGFNFEGTPWTGATRGYYGIQVVGGGHTIDGNAIGGLWSHGIVLSGPGTTGNVITNNRIGDASYNIGAGIDISGGAHDNVIGAAVFGTDSSGGNVIASNSGPGIAIEDSASTGNRIDGDNSIYANGGLAIDLGNNGATANDLAGGDTDTGPNNLQNFPVVTQAIRMQDGSVRVGGQLQVDHTGTARGYRFDLFLVDDVFCATQAMENHLGFFIRDTNGLVDVSWSNLSITAGLTPAIVPDLSGKSLVATATDPYGNTSEPSACVALKEDRIFSSGFGNPG